MKNCLKGSILMEFIIVLPIYCIFLGLAFFFGELSLHGINMTASGDRTMALSFGWQGRANSLFPTMVEMCETVAAAISPYSDREDKLVKYVEGGEEKVSNFDIKDCAGLVADTGFRGSWSWLVAATLKDNYALTPWTRSIVMPWRALRSDLGEANIVSEVSDLLDHTKIGRTTMTSRALGNVTRYAYYTLIRKGDGYSKGAYRLWGIGRIVDKASNENPTWSKCVCNEAFPIEGEGSFSNSSIDNGPSEGAEVGDPQPERRVYMRYVDFDTWTK